MWIARGKTYFETALITGIKYGTVKTNLDQARYKLNSATVAQATALAVAHGLFTLDDLAGREIGYSGRELPKRGPDERVDQKD